MRSRHPARAEAIQRDIVAAATDEFATNGYAGGRIDAIAQRTSTSKRLIFYYFGGKAGLYRAVLGDAYRRMRSVEAGLDLRRLPSLDALAQLVGSTFDYQWAHEDFVRLVMGENIHGARFLKEIGGLVGENLGALEALREICRRGASSGVMRNGLDPLDLHTSISALCFFHCAQRHTFALLHGVDMSSPDALKARRASIVAMILRFAAAEDPVISHTTGSPVMESAGLYRVLVA